MREIKFRAWDPDQGSMSPVRTISEWMGDVYDQAGAFNNDPRVIGFFEKLTYLQFTGLNNNGQDWYEGDILENDADWYQIAWDHEEARWEAIGTQGTHEVIAHSELLSSETWVQGNIYENPELLKSSSHGA